MSLCIKIKPLVLVGCSGSGRSAIIYNLTRNLPHKFERLISHTTRKPRPSQINNKHFYFVQQNWIKQNQNRFVTLTYSGNKNFYGLTYEQVSRVVQKNKIPIFKMTLDAYCKNIGQSGQVQIDSLIKQNDKGSFFNQVGNKKIGQQTIQQQNNRQQTTLYLLRNKKIECNALYVKIPSMIELQRRLKFSPFSKEQQAQKIQKAKKEHNEAQKYFKRDDIIGKYIDQGQQHVDDDQFQETIMRVKSRLFDLY